MNNKPYFSVILPTYNRVDKLRLTLQSLKKQTFKDFEVIICDDGSTDNTRELAGDFSKSLNMKYVNNGHWGGPARPRNEGIKIAKGEYIAFLDSDDIWYPNKLEFVKKNICDSDILYHGFDISTECKKKTFRKTSCRQLKNPIFIDLMKNGNALFTSGVVVKKGIINKAGGFFEDKSFISVEDFDLWLKIARITEKFCYIRKSLGIYHIDKNNISKASEEQINRITAVYNKHLQFLDENDREQAELMMVYLLARTKQKMGRLKDAMELFRKSRRANNKKIKFRSLIWIIFLELSLIFKQVNFRK